MPALTLDGAKVQIAFAVLKAIRVVWGYPNSTDEFVSDSIRERL